MKRLLATCLAAAALLTTPAGAAKDSLAFAFGRKGGTIMPYEVKIFSSGTVSVTGTVRQIEPVTVSPEALEALQKLTLAERFFSMPALTRCPETVAGLATNYIRVRIGKRDKTVATSGRCNKRLVGLLDVLKAVAAVSTETRGP